MTSRQINNIIDKLSELRYAQDNTVCADGVTVITINRNHLLETVKFLRDDNASRCHHLSYITAIDYISSLGVFHIVYEFVNLVYDLRIRLRVPVEEKDSWIPSITSIYPSANWHERELMEMFGIEARGHPDPRKLLLPDWLDDHPLRKDFPSGGDELWQFHEKNIEMFNKRGDYYGDTDDDWISRFE